MRQTTQKIYMECRLTTEELRDFAKKLAEAIHRKTRIENSLESFKAEKKAEIQQCDGEISLMSEKVNSEKEFRGVDCSIEFDFKKGKKTLKRKDTAEIYKVEEITDEERQEELLLQEKAKEKSAEKVAA